MKPVPPTGPTTASTEPIAPEPGDTSSRPTEMRRKHEVKLIRKPAGRATVRATALVFVTLVLALATTPATHAVGTARWQFDDAKDFLKGELEGLRVVSDGALRPGFREVALGEFGKEIWSATAAPDGTIYFGTGTPAAVHALAGNDKVRQIHAFEEDEVIAVTDLALDQQGRLYLATLAGGKILRLNPKRPDQVEVFGEFENHYLWAIRFDREGRLYVATGPEGKIYRLSPGGESREWYDTDDANILCLDFDQDGALLAGGSDSGKLYRITDPGEGTVIHQFKEQEIKALVRTGNDLFIGVNRQQDSGRGRGGPTISVSKPPSAPNKQPDSKAITQTARPTPPVAPVRLARPPSPVILHGAVYRRTATARYEELLQQSKEAVLALAPAAEGGVYAAFGDSGRVYRVIDIDDNELLFDFDEQQALTLAACEGRLCFVGTGNTGSGYRIETATATQPTFTSQPLDAAFRTRWGNAAWNPARGIQLATRSGNTSEPDDSWSDWSDPIRQSPGAITSPAARFLQVRVRLEADDAGRLDELEIFYRVQNQKPHIQEFSVEDAKKKNGKDNPPKSKSAGDSKPQPAPRPVPRR